ncbi:MAG: HDOD domain-containing protein [Lentisphaerota bacterium]
MSINPKLTALINDMQKMGRLPALDQNVKDICSLASDTGIQTADLTSIILRDAALTSNLLSVANSAAYRPRYPIRTVSSAVILLGFEKIRSLALGLSIFRKTRESARSRELFRLFTCAYFTGSVAMNLARQAKFQNPEEAFVAGLMHQLPRLLLANSFPERYVEMERLMMKDRLACNVACDRIFGIRYTEITEAIADYWNLPASLKNMILDVDRGMDPLTQMVGLAGSISDMLFGNVPAGAEFMTAAEQRMKNLLNLQDYTLLRFLEFTSESDDNLSKYFNLNRQDVEMMVKIAEWGRVNSAEVAANLTMGMEVQEAPQPQEDPHTMIGHFLSELMLSVRKRLGVNDVLMIAQESIYRCLNPICVFTAFLDKPRQFVTGRLYAGNNAFVKAADFRVAVIEKDYITIKCMESPETVQITVKGQQVLPHPELLVKLKLEYVLIAPIFVTGHAIGQYFVGRGVDKPFTSEEKLWLEAISGHVGMSFEQEKMDAHRV